MPDTDRFTVRPTPVRALIAAALGGGLAAWLLTVAVQAVTGSPPRPAWSAPVTLLGAAAVIGALAWTTHRQLQVRRQWMDPQRAVRLLVLGKASALGGALVVGGYLTFGLLFLGRWDAPLPRERVIRAAVSVLAGLGLAVAGLLLERACRVPKGPDDEDDEDPPAEFG